MEEMVADVSEDYIGIVIGGRHILNIMNKELGKKFGNSVHMRELKLGEKLSVLRSFNDFFFKRGFSGKAVKLLSLKAKNRNWGISLIREALKRKIDTLCVDTEVVEALRRSGDDTWFKLLNTYSDKATIQCADILAYGDSHHELIRNLWKDVSVERGEL